MFQQKENNNESLKQKRDRDQKKKEAELLAKCNEMANEKFGQDEVVKMSNANKGIWFLPVMDETGEKIEALALMKPIDRHTLSFAMSKLEDEGMSVFLEQCMRECFVASVEPDGSTTQEPDKCIIITEDEYFIPASMKFNKILEGKKVAFLKR
jgi:hypothetical protein